MQLIRLKPIDRVSLKTHMLIDGTGGPPLKDVTITIHNGLIGEVLPDRTDLPPFRYGETSSAGVMANIDCRDLTLLPGMVDCHVHLALDGVNFDASLTRWEYKGELQNHLEKTLENTLSAGILAVRDGGDRRLIGLGVSSLQRTNHLFPLVLASGKAIRKRGMYGTFLGEGLEGADIPQAVREIAAAGAAQLKIIVSGIVSFREYGRVGPLQFNRSELTALVEEAHKLGLKVMAHASSAKGADLAVRCAVDSLEHGYFIAGETLTRMAERGTAWVPTIIPVAGQLREPLHKGYTPSQLSVIEKTYRLQQKTVETAYKLGVVIGVGTDAGASGVQHGLSYVEELKLLLEAGIPPVEAIRAATSWGANILGLESIMGTVTPGKQAYLIGVKGNPLEDIEILRNPELVFIP